MLLGKNLTGCQVFEPSRLPADWDCVALKARLQLLYGRGLKEEVRKSGNVDVFGSNGIVGCHDVHWLDAPGVLVGRKGTVGAVHYSKRAFWPIDTTYYVRATADDNLRYIFHLLDYLPLKSLNAATGVPGLSRRDVYALLGAFPPLKEQAAIACVLDAADDAIDRAGEAFTKAVSLDHSLLHFLLDRGNPTTCRASILLALRQVNGGAGGIRTLDTALQPYNGLANRRLQPLGHSSIQNFSLER